MPTHDEEQSFWRDWALLTNAQKKAFLTAVGKMTEDLKAGRALRLGLRVKGVQGHPGVYEMTWAGDGRATFHFGKPQRANQVHIVWRRVGTHDILTNP